MAASSYHGLGGKLTYPIEQAKIGRDVRLENMDEGQDLVFVAPQQLVHRVCHEEFLLVGLQHGLHDVREQAALDPFYDRLGSRRGSGHEALLLSPPAPLS